MTRATPGNIDAARMSPVTKNLPRKSTRASAYAVNTPKVRASAVVTELMITELMIAPRKLLPPSVDSASRKLSSVMFEGSGLAENTNRLSRKAVTSIQ